MLALGGMVAVVVGGPDASLAGGIDLVGVALAVGAALSQAVFDSCVRGDFDAARQLREFFIPLEDLRDAWGPARVLHAAVDLAGITPSGPIPPFISALSESQQDELAPVAAALHAANLAHAPLHST